MPCLTMESVAAFLGKMGNSVVKAGGFIRFDCIEA